jgi:hypothetical protein
MRGLSGCAVLAVLAVTPPASVLAQTPPAAPEKTSVVDGIKTMPRPDRSFLPKYRPEWFAGIGYSGTFISATHQWPTLIASGEVLFARPGRFDFGLYLPLRLGRPDEHEGRFEVGFGPEVMWRALENGVFDGAVLLRVAYLLDVSHVMNPLIRSGIGAQVSLVRSLAVQLTYDPLVSADRTFTNGNHLAHGLTAGFNVGFCPMLETCAQVAQKPVETLDRSSVTCHQAARVCQSARTAPDNSSAALCAAALRALDTSEYPVDWGDPVSAFLRGLEHEAPAPLKLRIGPALVALMQEHRASIEGVDAYAERLRGLGASEMLSSKYSYVVTPSMVRDWLGCRPGGAVLECATNDTCERDTGVARQ